MPFQFDALSSADLPARVAKIQRLIPPQVRLIAVTKTFPAAVVRAAYAAGLREFAENKVQEALTKQAELGDLTDVTWHFIGHLQSNKTRKVLESFDWVHSIDSLKLATRLDRQAADLGRQPNCCLQVKLAPDPTKDGFDPAELMAALPALDQLCHLNIQGLMVIAPYGLQPEQTQAVFERAQALAAKIEQQGWQRITMNELSMGMSDDFELAIAAGATLVRIGSGLFGRRN
ncbi:YggS family pyridoxal phosphate-dependent enzyme [Leptolyngbya sp. BC1307]|uniref:YggS family pyridoxal phosphate-dependent enzyme n=1 Tax=Leptolyngbya sp. BC1307 TaxID=2029589 RepID=UPI000EFBD3C8|nr:YggS family pyridoxal phosphate-dependent enzyme [Leptolyngbya sp. BC1307]